MMVPSPEETDPLLPGSRCNEAQLRRNWIRTVVILSTIVVSFFLSYVVTVIIYNPYLYDVVAREFPFFNSTSQSPCLPNMSAISFNTTGKLIQEEIFRRVATIELYLNLTNYLVAVLPILILGPLTDRYGRKLSFIFAISGTIMKQVVYILVIYLDISVYWLLLGHLLDGLGGSFAGMITSIFSVISDISEPGKKRSMHIAATEALQTISFSAATLCAITQACVMAYSAAKLTQRMIVAQWIKVSYTMPLWYGLTLSLYCLFTVIFLMPETSQNARLIVPTHVCHQSCDEFFQGLISGLHLVKKSLTLYIQDDSGRKKLAKRRLVLAIFTFTVAVNFSLPGVQSLFLMKFPLCWSATKVNMYYGGSLVSNWVVILCLLALLQRLFNMPDRGVAIIGAISSGVSCAFLSVAINDIMIYEVAVLNVCTRVIVPMMRSVITGLVEPTEQGAAYAGMGCIETIAASVFSLAANRIFYATLSVWAGSIFLIFAGIMLFSLVLLVILNIQLSRERITRRLSVNINNGPVNSSLESDPSW